MPNYRKLAALIAARDDARSDAQRKVLHSLVRAERAKVAREEKVAIERLAFRLRARNMEKLGVEVEIVGGYRPDPVEERRTLRWKERIARQNAFVPVAVVA